MYIDIIWLLNLCFDSLLLLWTSLLQKQKPIWWRWLLGGAVGSATVWLYITPYAFLIDMIIVKISISICMLFINNGFRHWKKFLQTLLTFYLLTFVAGGALYGLHNLFFSQTSQILTSSHSHVNLYGDQASWLFVIVSFPLTYLFLKLYSSNIKTIKINRNQEVTVNCQVNGLSLDFLGLIDTGNQLRDPISRLPIIILSVESQFAQFPQELLVIIENGFLADIDLASEWQSRMRVIPYQVVGNAGKMLVAFKPDQVMINNQQRKCLISFTNQRLSSDRNFTAIVHPELLEA